MTKKMKTFTGKEMKNMRFVDDRTLEMLKKRYPRESRVELIDMDDPQAPDPGTKGTVIGVDDTGSIMVNWDNGSRLNALYLINTVKKIED